MPRKYRRHRKRMRGGNQIQKIETGTKNIQLINMLQKPKERQSPYRRYGTGRIRGSGTAYAYVDKYGSMV